MLLALALLVAGYVYAGPREREARKQTALDRYGFKPDSNFSYNLVNTIKGAGCKAYVLELTSQQWRTADEVDRPLWKHWLTIIQPDHVNTSTGFLLINGGSNGGRMPSSADASITSIAVGTHAVVADSADGAERAIDLQGRRQVADRRCDYRLQLGEVLKDGRRNLASALADDQSGGAGPGHGHSFLREGYTAYFVELTFPSAGKYPFRVTTGVRVTPDSLPFPLPTKEAAAQTTR
jgi:PhoPQ-activated pathogenicity-related protein